MTTHSLTRTYATTAAALWELWTTPEGIARWWAPDGFAVEVQALDLRPGGELVYAMTAVAPEQVAFMNDHGMPLTTVSRKTFTAVEAPRRLAYDSLVDFVPGTEPYTHATTVDLTPAEDGGTTVTMPLDAVRRCVRLAADEMAAATATARLAHEGEVLPFLPLAVALHATPPEETEAGSGVAIVLAADRDTVAIGVDRLAGTTTLVARPLPDLAPAAPVIGSVSIDLDGNPRLVLDAHGLVTEARQESGAARDESATATRSRLPILVVDDSLTTRQLERSILESAGFEVDLAASGEEGLAKARARSYGLYLTDIDMPGIDGFTFVERTRADPALAAVPAILVSSRASAEDRRRGTEAGASAYVVKGEFNQEELLAHIRRLIL